MKKQDFSSFLLLGVLTLFIAGCGGNTKNNGEDGNVSAATEQSEQSEKPTLKDQLAGTWRTTLSDESFGFTMGKLTYTFKPNGALKMQLTGKGDTPDEGDGYTATIGFTMSLNGTWNVSGDELTKNIDFDTMNLKLNKIRINTEEGLSFSVNEMAEMMGMDISSLRNEFENLMAEELVKEIRGTLNQGNSEVTVISNMTADSYREENADGTFYAFRRVQ